VLRFDFTGLGSSEGEFANTNFSSNVEDLVAAADFLRASYRAPALLIGHSLGGAAVLAAAHRVPEAKAVVTIGAPADVAHVLAHLGAHLEDIEQRGEATVTLAGRQFAVRKQFVDDAKAQALHDRISRLGRALLVMHSPIDQTVGIENATAIFQAARHPKSFVSLDDADHLLSRERDASYAAQVIAGWSSRFLPEAPAPADAGDAAAQGVSVSETGAGKFQNMVVSGSHRLLADEPKSVGGLDSGPTPYDFVSIALAACTSMTLRLYADRKKLDLGRISVSVSHGKVAAEHCADCGEAAEGRTGKIDRFERTISIEGGVAPDQSNKLLDIADKCPVHRTLESASAIVTKIG
jgi:putative redox protein